MILTASNVVKQELLVCATYKSQSLSLTHTFCQTRTHGKGALTVQPLKFQQFSNIILIFNFTNTVYYIIRPEKTDLKSLEMRDTDIILVQL